MSLEPNYCDKGDDVSAALGASLLATSKYGRLWRRTLYIRIFISLSTRTRTTSSATRGSERSSSISYSSLPSSPSPSPSRTSSAKSSLAIDVPSDHEELGDVCLEQRIKNDIARIVKDKDLESLRELGGVDRVCSVLCRLESEGGNIDNGNHQVLQNTDVVRGRSFPCCFWNSCKRNGYTISFLIISALLSLAIDIKEEGIKYGWHDTAAILVALIMIVSFSSVANYWRENKMLKLSEKKGELKVAVVRDGRHQLIAISDIMVGDTVCLKMGDVVPADGLLLNNEELDPFLLFDSKVSYEGENLMIVTSVRDKKSVEIQNSAACDSENITLLESQIEKPISYIDKLALLISTLVALVVLIRLICKKNGDSTGLPEIKGNVSVGFLMKLIERIFLKPQGKVCILTSLITVAIISMQHGLPLMVTISLKYQIDKMVPNQDANLYDLSASATMGLVTVICVDASGGLISKLMEVGKIRIGERYISNVISETNPVVLNVLQQGVSVSVLAPELILSPVSNSLIYWAETTWGINRESFSQNFTIIQQSKQNSKEDGSGVLVRKVGDDEPVMHLHWSGAASTILEMCSNYYDFDGECPSITNQKIQFGQVIKEMEDSDLEPIALAYQKTESRELKQDGLILLAVIGLKHSCLDKTKSVLEELKKDGINIKLVSRQDVTAVRALACELGIEVPVEDGFILEGKEFQVLDNTDRLKKLDKALVMGGFLPDDKVLMIQCLKDVDHVVAFFGGLTVSNTPALEAADIAIVDQSQSPETDRKCSNISITCLSAITAIVRGGRCQYNNIQKFVQLHLTATLSGSFITLITTICRGESPLTAFQLIWVNLIMCFLGGLMMLMKLNIDEDQCANQPYNRKQSLITQEIWKVITIHVLYQASVSMIFLYVGKIEGNTEQVRKAMVFNTFMLCQVFNQLKILGLWKKRVFKIVLQSYCFLVTLGVCLIMQVLVTQYANSLTDYMRLNATQWVICFSVAVHSWVFEWPLKILFETISLVADYLLVSV